MIRRLLDKLFLPVPGAHALSFRNVILPENFTRLFIGGATLSAVEMGVLISLPLIQRGNYFYPLAVMIFNAVMIPIFIVLRRREGRIRQKRGLVYVTVLFYLVWACSFTWSNRAVNPEYGMNILFSPYMLMVYGIAIIVYLEPAWSAVLFLLSFGLFLAMIPVDVLSRREVAINMWNALALNIFAWVSSRLFFAFRLRTFIDNRLIHDKNIELDVERKNLLDALEDVSQLSGLLPICSACKKVRDDNGYWQQVEQYIAQRSGVTFTHGLCPDCAKKIYPEEKE